MTFANAATLGVVAGKREELIALLTRHSDALRDLGCLAHEVGVNDDTPDTVFVVEPWETREAHRASLSLPDVQASIAAARPLLSGEFGGFGSPSSVHRRRLPAARLMAARDRPASGITDDAIQGCR